MAGRPLGSVNGSYKRALAVRLAIEDRLKKSIPEKIVDLIEQLDETKDQLQAYLAVLPYAYPKLQVQTIVDASEMGLETEAAITEAKRLEWTEIQKAKLELKTG